jgi:hypothetical protein
MEKFEEIYFEDRYSYSYYYIDIATIDTFFPILNILIPILDIFDVNQNIFEMVTQYYY